MKPTTMLLMVIISFSKATSNIVDVAVNIASKDFDLRKVTIVAWWRDNEFVSDFLKDFSGSIFALNLYNKTTKVKCEQYVVFTETTANYDTFLAIIKEDQVLPVKILLVISDSNVTNENLTNVTESSWKMDITDLAIIHNGGDKDVKLTTYFPKSENNCDNYHPVTFNISGVTDYFPRKFKNFFGCPIRISLLDWSPYVIIHRNEIGNITNITGTEGRLVDILLRYLNASIIPVFPNFGNFGVLTPYGHWTGTVGDLVYNRADVSATSAVASLDRYKAVQLTHSYKIMTLLWVSPTPREIRAWARVLLPFFTNITLLLGLTCLIFFIACTLIQWYKLRDNIGRPILFNCWAIFLGQYVKFESVSCLLNCLFILWVWVCLIIRIAYQGELVKDLEKQILEPPFKTFAEAHSSIQNYGGTESVATFYKNTSIAKDYKTLNLKELREKAMNISYGERFLLAIDRAVLRQMGCRVHILDEVVLRSPVGIFIRRRWAASREFDLIILQIIESGVYEKIRGDYISMYTMRNSRSSTTHDLHYVRLDLLHLSGCFYGLFIECLFCCLLLVLEIVWHRYTQETIVSQYKK